RPPSFPPSLISMADAHAIIDGAIAYARERNIRMAVAVVDQAGELMSSDRMDGASGRSPRSAEGKAVASAMYRQTSEALADLYKTRPDRYFGILSMYGGKVYLSAGGVPLAVDGK